jgi:hypothetical protein
VEVLLYTEEGVLVYRESYRWSPDEQDFVGRGFAPRVPERHSRS